MSTKRTLLNKSLALAGATFLTVAVVRARLLCKRGYLQQKVVLITGGSRGLGFAIAEQLALSGARLALTSRNLDELERARERLVTTANILPEDIFLQACDVTNPEEVRNLVQNATSYFGQIDVVVNNAGVIVVGPLASQKLASYQQAMNVNFFGALHTTLAVLPQMLSRESGVIVNIASIGGKVAFPHLLPYVASKFALTGWSQGLHAELAGKGIRVLTVSPGVMRTGSHVQARYSGDQVKEYQWFASAASFPGTAVSARTAAKKIVRTLSSNKAEIAIGISAIAAARASNVAPEFTAAALSLVNQFLPKLPAGAGHEFWDDDHSVAGKQLQGSLPSPLEWLGKLAEHQYNQD
jgi:short-subunit dehydrogenase